MMVLNPKAWAKAVFNMHVALVQPDVYDSIIAQPQYQEVLRKLIPHGLTMEGLEASTAVAPGGALEKVLPKGVSRRVEAIFTAPINIGKLEMARALLPWAERHGELTELASFLNNMTGTSSSLAAGLGALHRTTESTLLFFSPRMTRSVFTLLGDALKVDPGAQGLYKKTGGLKGWLSRQPSAALCLRWSLSLPDCGSPWDNRWTESSSIRRPINSSP
jgi:hypothetical protein